MQKERLDEILTHGVHHGASDVHFKVASPPTYRIHGVLRPIQHDPLSPAETFAIAKILARRVSDGTDLLERQECDTSYSVSGVARFRANVYVQRGSLSCVLRVIPSQVPTLEHLALPARVSGLAEEERGIVLVTGATGSGKSSTLAAIVQHINERRSVHVLTIEDPIEFLYANRVASISQREVGTDTRSFATALRAALRQDPDVILVGEMRDPETIDIALKAAETGHMVFSTVHTTDATKTIGRLVSVFPAEEQRHVRTRVADNLKGVVSQRLLPRADGNGRVLAAEVLVATRNVQDHIREESGSAALRELIERGRDQYGMQTFDQHLQELFSKGVITLEVARAAATSPDDFDQELAYGERSSYGGEVPPPDTGPVDRKGSSPFL